MIAPKGSGQATPLCYASSERFECMKLTCGTVLRGLAVVALLAGGAVRQCAAQEAVTEPTVVSVRIVREDGTVLKDGPEGLPVQTGKPVDRGHVARACEAFTRAATLRICGPK